MTILTMLTKFLLLLTKLPLITVGHGRLGASPAAGPLKPSGETWEVAGLFVADASVFPTALGINPMVTVEAVAYMIAGNVAGSLGASVTSAVTSSAATASNSSCSSNSDGSSKAVFVRDSIGPSGSGDYGVSLQDLQW
jgi:GMC oxidoreductase